MIFFSFKNFDNNKGYIQSTKPYHETFKSSLNCSCHHENTDFIFFDRPKNVKNKINLIIKYCVFQRILKSLPPLLRQHSAAIGCIKKMPANRSDWSLALR